MKKYLRYSIVGILFLLVFIVMLVPASFIVDKASENIKQVVIFGVSGSAWNGKVSSMQVGKVNINDFEWDLSVLSLIIGRIKSDLTFEIFNKNIDITVGASSFGKGAKSIEGLIVDVDAAEIQGIAGLGNMPIELTGNIALDIKELVISEDFIPKSGVGRIDWKSAGVAIGKQNALFGDFLISMKNDGDWVEAKVMDATKTNPIELNVVVRVAENGDINIKGKAGYRENIAPVLKSYLKMCLKMNGDVVDIKGNLRKKGKAKLQDKIKKSFLSCPFAFGM